MHTKLPKIKSTSQHFSTYVLLFKYVHAYIGFLFFVLDMMGFETNDISSIMIAFQHQAKTPMCSFFVGEIKIEIPHLRAKDFELTKTQMQGKSQLTIQVYNVCVCV